MRYPSTGITSRLEVDGLGERIKVNITILKNLGKVNQMYCQANLDIEPEGTLLTELNYSIIEFRWHP